MKKVLVMAMFIATLGGELFSQQSKVKDSEIIPEERNPALAFACSAIMPGLGQMYNNQSGAGFGFLGGVVVGLGIASYGEGEDEPDVRTAGYLLSGAVWVVSIFHAVFTAESITNESREKKALLRRKNTELGFMFDNGSTLNLEPYMKGEAVGLNFSYSF